VCVCTTPHRCRTQAINLKKYLNDSDRNNENNNVLFRFGDNGIFVEMSLPTIDQKTYMDITVNILKKNTTKLPF
jgi:hypothetical protein